MLFKKLHKKQTPEIDESEKEESIEELESRLQKQIKKKDRRLKIRKIIIYVVMFMIAFGSFKSLISVNKQQPYVLAVNDYAFVDEYVSNYFKWPKDAATTDYLTRFTNTSVTSSIEYDTNKTEAAVLNNSTIYSVKTNTDSSNTYYVKAALHIVDKDKKEQDKPMYIKVTTAQKNGGYIVVKPIEMAYTTISDLSDAEKKQYEVNKNTEGTDCTDKEKTELTNTVALFLKTYAADYNQAKLLTATPTDLDPLDPKTTINIDAVNSVKQTSEKYIVDANVTLTTDDIVKQKRLYRFNIDKKTNKIMKLEEY